MSETAGVAKVAVSAGGVTVDVVTVGSPWQGGFNGAVRLTNTSFACAHQDSFQIVFKMAGNAGISNAWNGTISAADASGNHTATNPDWLQYGPSRRARAGTSGSTARVRSPARPSSAW